MNIPRYLLRSSTAALLCGLLAGCGLSAPPSDSPLPQDAAATETASPFLPLSESESAASSPTPSPRITDTPMSLPSPEPSATPTASPPLVITMLYNNIPYDQRLQTDWGFSALVEWEETVLLFDTGGNGAILMNNMRLMEVDPERIRYVVLSHIHTDHTGGLPAFLNSVVARPPVYLLPGFGASYIQSVRARTEVVETSPGLEIAPGILTTGNAGGSVPEQALIVRTNRGLVVITGCAHPGIVRIVELSVELTGDEVYLVMGGFHLMNHSTAQISAILQDFRRLGVQNAAPSHCTGDRAISMFAEEYGDHYLPTGAGSILQLDG
ncbi:MAG: MBL fold metallo-hydrolase [Anaerolineales bacterium]